MLDCGHPEDCWDNSDEDDEHCQWCAENGHHEERIQALRNQLGEQAIIVEGGTCTIKTPWPIGLLEINNGTVNMQTSQTGDLT